MGSGLTRIFLGEIIQNTSKPVQIFWSYYTICILSVYTLLKVVSYYDLSALSTSVMSFKKKSLDGGWQGVVSSIQVFFGFLEFF